MEECLGWCYDVKVDPTPLRRIGREWMKRASALRTLLEALHVRVTPEKFCCGFVGVPYAIALLLGRILEGSRKWQTEVHCWDPGLWLMDTIALPSGIWWFQINYSRGTWRRLIKEEPST